MNKRDQLQEEWAKCFSHRGILHLCPRAGKIRTSIRIFQKLGKKPNVLIAYPDKNIQKGWEDDIEAVGYNNPYVNYTTHMSLGKHFKTNPDILVVDEIHLLSLKQKENLREIMKSGVKVLGLSGTLSNKTENELLNELGLPVLVNYTIDEAIKDGLISDYKITVLKTDLDNSVIIDPKKNKTEAQKYRGLTWVIENKGQNLFLNLARMRIIHNSLSKIKKTKEILNSLSGERVLVFCPNNEVAKALGINIHTSKFNDQKAFEKFIKGTGKNNHMAVCKIGNTGVSFKSLRHIVIEAFDSNSENLTQRICRSLILDEPGKVSEIFIVTSTEKAELNWLSAALEFFDKKKVFYK